MKQVKVRLGNRFGFIESDIETIYDAEKAKQHKQEIDEEIATCEKKLKKQKIKDPIIVFCLVTALIIAVYTIKNEYLAITAALIIMIPATMYLYKSLLRFIYNTNITEYEYPTEIKYFLATEGKQILSITVEPTFSDYSHTVKIVTENEDHTINKTELDFMVVEKTEINHIILNVNKGIVFVPYEREKGRRC